MELLSCLDELPIDKNCDLPYKRMTFDGCKYYFLSEREEKIVVMDLDFNLIRSVDVCKEYTCICYDCSENCFWATAKNCFNTIFKLNYKLEEVDTLKINELNKLGGIITGISYNYCCDSLLISLNNCIAEYHKTTKDLKLRKSFYKIWVNSVLYLCPGYVITAIKDQKQFIMFFDYNHSIKHSICVDSKYFIKDIIINYNNKEHLILEYFTTKNSIYPYIRHFILNYNCLNFSSCCYEICNRYCNKNSDYKCLNNKYDFLNSILVARLSNTYLLEIEEKNICDYLFLDDNLSLLFANRRIDSLLNNAITLENILFNNITKNNDDLIENVKDSIHNKL